MDGRDHPLCSLLGRHCSTYTPLTIFGRSKSMGIQKHGVVDDAGVGILVTPDSALVSCVVR
jgi:hypothetical protein